MGLTGTTEPSAPATLRTPGAEPVFSESTSKAHRRTPGAQHLLVLEIHPHYPIAQEAGTGKTGQRRQVDVGVRKRVVSGDQAGEHPGVGRVRFPRDEREPDAGKRLLMPKCLSTATWVCPPPTSTRSSVTGRDGDPIAPLGMA